MELKVSSYLNIRESYISRACQHGFDPTSDLSFVPDVFHSREISNSTVFQWLNRSALLQQIILLSLNNNHTADNSIRYLAELTEFNSTSSLHHTQTDYVLWEWYDSLSCWLFLIPDIQHLGEQESGFPKISNYTVLQYVQFLFFFSSSKTSEDNVQLGLRLHHTMHHHHLAPFTLV